MTTKPPPKKIAVHRTGGGVYVERHLRPKEQRVSFNYLGRAEVKGYFDGLGLDDEKWVNLNEALHQLARLHWPDGERQAAAMKKRQTAESERLHEALVVLASFAHTPEGRAALEDMKHVYLKQSDIDVGVQHDARDQLSDFISSIELAVDAAARAVTKNVSTPVRAIILSEDLQGKYLPELYTQLTGKEYAIPTDDLSELDERDGLRFVMNCMRVLAPDKEDRSLTTPAKHRTSHRTKSRPTNKLRRKKN